MSDYKKTAKDLAFDRERMKLQKQIRDLRQENQELKSEIEERIEVCNKREKLAEVQFNIIESFKSMFDVPKDELEQYICNENEKVAREKRGVEAVEMLKNMMGLCRGFY